jgi:hypothetical protein
MLALLGLCLVLLFIKPNSTRSRSCVRLSAALPPSKMMGWRLEHVLAFPFGRSGLFIASCYHIADVSLMSDDVVIFSDQ